MDTSAKIIKIPLNTKSEVRSAVKLNVETIDQCDIVVPQEEQNEYTVSEPILIASGATLAITIPGQVLSYHILTADANCTPKQAANALMALNHRVYTIDKENTVILIKSTYQSDMQMRIAYL